MRDEPPVKRRRGRPVRNPFDVSGNGVNNGLHGLSGLEITALRKSFNGDKKYDFEKFLKESVPEQYTINVIDDKEESERLFRGDDCELKLFKYGDDEKDDENLSLNGMKERIDMSKFEINLIDHERIKGPDKNTGKVGIDPLDDASYNKIHEKLSRREKKFTTSDRLKMLNEVDNCIELLSILGTGLRKSALKDILSNYVVENIELSDEHIYRLSQLLGTITHINDPTNTYEMILKYRLTVREIRSFLLNYFKVKTLEDMLKKEIRRIQQIDNYDPFIEPITNDNIEELKEIRLKDRDKRMGKIVTIKFKENVELLVDPISKPKVVIRK